MDEQKKDGLAIRDHEVYKNNPYEKMLAVYITENKKEKIDKVLSQTGQVTDRETGEIMKIRDDSELDSLFVATKKYVDRDAFTKIYHESIKHHANIGDAAVKVLTWYIAGKLGKEELEVVFDLDECATRCNYSKATIYRALGELLDAEIIARTKYQWKYFINPLFIFNGDRIKVTNIYIKKNIPGGKLRLQ